MLQQFKSLNEADRQTMTDAIPLVTILIAGADGNIDQKETAWAEKIMKIRSYSADEALLPFYKKVGASYADRMEELVAELPAEVEERQTEISGRLAQLNTIFPKMDAFYSRSFYKSLMSFSEHVAKSSGGFLGFLSIGDAEDDWIKLPMITEPEI